MMNNIKKIFSLFIILNTSVLFSQDVLTVEYLQDLLTFINGEKQVLAQQKANLEGQLFDANQSLYTCQNDLNYFESIADLAVDHFGFDNHSQLFNYLNSKSG